MLHARSPATICDRSLCTYILSIWIICHIHIASVSHLSHLAHQYSSFASTSVDATFPSYLPSFLHSRGRLQEHSWASSWVERRLHFVGVLRVWGWGRGVGGGKVIVKWCGRFVAVGFEGAEWINSTGDVIVIGEHIPPRVFITLRRSNKNLSKFSSSTCRRSKGKFQVYDRVLGGCHWSHPRWSVSCCGVANLVLSVGCSKIRKHIAS